MRLLGGKLRFWWWVLFFQRWREVVMLDLVVVKWISEHQHEHYDHTILYNLNMLNFLCLGCFNALASHRKTYYKHIFEKNRSLLHFVDVFFFRFLGHQKTRNSSSFVIGGWSNNSRFPLPTSLSGFATRRFVSDSPGMKTSRFTVLWVKKCWKRRGP